MSNRKPPKRTSAECAAAGRKGKTRSPWFRQPHVHRDQNYTRMEEWGRRGQQATLCFKCQGKGHLDFNGDNLECRICQGEGRLIE